MITNLVIFAFIVGLLTGAVVVGAITWSKALGLKMSWWKWLLSCCPLCTFRSGLSPYW